MSKVGIIGGGYSGVISAIYASKNNEVTILERNNILLKKLLLTGNGRCNYFNSVMTLDKFHSNNKELIEEIITMENIEELDNFFIELGLFPKVKNGYYYPYSNQASSVKDLLLSKLKELNVNIKTEYLVEKIEKKDNKFIVNNALEFDKIIISTGGKAYPKTGSDGMGYDLLKSFGHTITKLSPSLVQITSDNKFLKELSGIRSEVNLSLFDKDKKIKEEQGELQFTDYGISGICTFNLSSYLRDGIDNKYVLVNFMPIDIKSFTLFMEGSSNTIFERLEGILNYKLVKVLLKLSNIKETDYWKDITSKQKEDLINNLFNYRVNITGTKSFDQSQVTAGGVVLSEINTKTMESKLVKDLYVTGEVLDLDGECGGYNLTLCFITGYIAGANI
ncbi:MAG: aminoacetone oxidase family FAD-binding enzyme [Bacilli bacterium]|nr:aminoacetone oxidase family FAD-binding enzyme [Bacilli bacterium]